MRDSDAVRIAKIDRDKAMINGIMGVVQNPIIELILAFTLIEALQKVMVKTPGRTLELFGKTYVIPPGEEPLFGTAIGTTLELAMASAQFIGPIAEGIGKIAGAVNPVPALAAVNP